MRSGISTAGVVALAVSALLVGYWTFSGDTDPASAPPIDDVASSVASPTEPAQPAPASLGSPESRAAVGDAVDLGRETSRFDRSTIVTISGEVLAEGDRRGRRSGGAAGDEPRGDQRRGRWRGGGGDGSGGGRGQRESGAVGNGRGGGGGDGSGGGRRRRESDAVGNGRGGGGGDGRGGGRRRRESDTVGNGRGGGGGDGSGGDGSGRGPRGRGRMRVRIREQAVVRTATETITVHLGPRRYRKRHGLGLQAGDTVVVTGSRIVENGTPVILVTTLRLGEEQLALRDETGTPLWK